MNISVNHINDVKLITAHNHHLKVEIAPEIGGRITSIYNMELQKEFLWNNEELSLAGNLAGADYDSNFWGGIDELIPNDIAETIDGLAYPDHGELWTLPLKYSIASDGIAMFGSLPISGLFYQKTLSLDAQEPVIHLKYKIRNDSKSTRHFLWKLHAAVQIEASDRLVSSAQKAKIVSADSSRFSQSEQFQWPVIENTNASLVPVKTNTMDFFYLYETSEPKMGILSSNGEHLFEYCYDHQIFPYQWYFASYGKFNGHYTSILEPATAMPVSVTEAKNLGQCSVLQPGEEINTSVSIYVGKNNGKY